MVRAYWRVSKRGVFRKIVSLAWFYRTHPLALSWSYHRISDYFFLLMGRASTQGSGGGRVGGRGSPIQRLMGEEIREQKTRERRLPI